MRRRYLLIVVCALFCGTVGAQDQRFENPPKEARPYVWRHWLNGNTSKDGIRKDLEWMNRIGIVGFHQFDAGGSIFINGQHVDFLWKAPYKVNFEGQLKPGKNTIEVKVVNTWVNRLIGDGQPGVEGHSFTPVAFYGVKSLSQNMGTLIPSGLMGPVHLYLCTR